MRPDLLQSRKSAALLALAALAACGQSEAPDDATRTPPPEAASMLPVEEALAGAHVPTLDPATMVEAEIRAALGSRARCEFRYTTAGKPVLAVAAQETGPASGVVKLNGHMVALQAARLGAGAAEGGFRLEADPVLLTIPPEPSAEAEEQDSGLRREATLLFELGERLRVGYRGYLDCRAESGTHTR